MLEGVLVQIYHRKTYFTAGEADSGLVSKYVSYFGFQVTPYKPHLHMDYW
jgi:hypothetical protein